MSWIRRRPLAAVVLLALTLRAAAAVVTELHPIFPDYYYTDANVFHDAAVRSLQGGSVWSAEFNGTLSERIQVLISAGIYAVFGMHPFAVKLLNAAGGAVCVALLFFIASAFASREAALSTALLAALWPSHVFYFSQNLKEASVSLLAYAGLLLALSAGFGKGALREAAPRAAGACAFLLAAGFYRSYVLLCLSGALLLSLLWECARTRPPKRALLTMLAVAAALAAYPRASRGLLDAFNNRSALIQTSQRSASPLMPVTIDELDPEIVHSPTSPRGITGFRQSRQRADRRWARTHSKREIGTQIYPDASFESWGDVLAYLPKGAFHVLFMPLPGLYPMDGKLGRYLAAIENVALLALAALAAAGLTRGPKLPVRLVPLLFFAAMTTGAALLEFDLGSSGRHKLLYFPMLFPFAAEELLRRRSWRPS